MRPRTKLLILACAVVVATLSLRDASAGNVSAPSAEYFSVELTLGQYLSHSDSNATILVDDVTYSCEWSPCDPEQECLFFLAVDLPPAYPPGTDMREPPPPHGLFLHPGGAVPPGLRPIPGQPPAPPTSSNFYYSPYTLFDAEWGWSVMRPARGVFGAVRLRDTDGQAAGYVVDRYSLDSYGQIAEIHDVQIFGAEPSESEGYATGPQEEGDVGVGVGGISEVGVGRDVVTPTTTVSWPSSASRHYQSPHIVRLGRVYLEDVGNGTMHSAVACVKGRIILSPATPPTVSTGISVSGP